MARKSSSSAQSARPDVASRSKFDALAVDTIDSSSESDSELPLSTLSAPLLAPPSSKKAAARRRAQLRKNAPEVDSSTDAPVLPPIPALPTALKKEAQKVEKKIAQVVEVATAPQALSTPENPTLLPTESASSSDAETAEHYTDEDDDASELDEPSPSPTPLAPSPRPLPPSPPHSPIDAAVPVYTGADHDPKKKLQAIIQRTVAGVLMASSLVAIVCLGHVYVIVLVFVCQAVVFSELSALFDAGSSGVTVEEGGEVSQKRMEREVRRKGRREKRDRWSRRISWYFFATTNYFLYGESLIYYFKHILTLQASFLPTTFSFAQHHRLVSFGLYVIGFVSFVANLKRTQLRRQFGLFGWIHMSLLLVVISSHFIVNSIVEGLIWFWVPASLVIMNDIAAYVCGMMFGRHQLIKLSPKKTVEGFVGAFFVTIAFAVIWGTFFMRFNYMICPAQDLATNVFSNVQCVPNRVFNWREFLLPAWAVSGLYSLTHHTISSIPWNPFQLHCVVMAIFASLVAPFGGFFASGFKRAFNIKDFGASIPGHGGVTDRMDCQFLMGLFSYLYYASLIRETHVTVGSVLATVVSALSTEEQLELVKEVGKVLAAKGIKAAVPW